MAATSQVLSMTSGSTEHPRQPSATGFNWFHCWVVLVLCLAVLGALRKSWISDDAFLSFRYAENLVQGKGLVFNAGERAEGIANLGWTLWIALGMWLRFDPEKWSVAWGILFFAANIALLTRYHAFLKASGIGVMVIPVAALLSAVHSDWVSYASSGLEISAFTFLLTAAFFAVATLRSSYATLLLAGALLGAAVWIRPEGLIFAASTGLYLGIRTRGSVRAILTYALAITLMAGILFYWRVLYYGEFLPNPYYAKSADIPSYSRGFYYIAIYFERYWCLLLWIPLLPWIRRACAASARAGQCKVIGDQLLFLLMLILPHLFYLVRAGGDSMFARMLIPVTPFLALLTELAIASLFRTPWAQLAASGAVVLSLLFTPASIAENLPVRGIIDERLYSARNLKDWGESSHRTGETLKKYFDLLPARIGFFGGQARLIFYSKIPYATECETGRTDYFIARQTLDERDRIGYEKHVPILYLLEQNKLMFVFEHRTPYSWNRYIPYVTITMGTVRGRILYWDPFILNTLKQRGAAFPNFPTELDAYLKKMPGMPADEIRRDYRKFRNFYFARVRDPQREAKFLERLRETPASEKP